MKKNKRNLLYRIADFGFLLIYKLTDIPNSILKKMWEKISQWMCPHDYHWHYFFYSCLKCENYCVEHDREVWDQCPVCEILGLNQNDFSIKVLENCLHRIQHGDIEIEETYYQENKYKYVA
jgi:hypothetical protein